MHVQSVLPRDAIPSIDDPEFSKEYFGDPDDEVVVVDGEQPRAYPIRILSYHEIVNDTVDASPIAVTWCPICWSAAVYDRQIDGRTLTFGVSGKLADDALVLYDRETGTEWKQTTGEAISGELEGTRLATVPAPIVSWDQFTDEYSDGVVLQPVRGSDREGGQSPGDIYDMEPYEQYAAGDEFGLYGMRGEGERRSWDRDDLDPKSVVLGIEYGDEAVGYPIQRVRDVGGVITDRVAGRDIVVFATDDEIHAFENPGYDFETHDDEIHADGTTWNEVTGESADGRQLGRVSARRLFAFAWQDAHGEDAFYG